MKPWKTAVRQGIDFLVSDKAVRADNVPGRHAGNHRFLDNPGRIFSNFPHLHSAGKVIQDGNGHLQKPHRDCLEDAAERTGWLPRSGLPPGIESPDGNALPHDRWNHHDSSNPEKH